MNSLHIPLTMAEKFSSILPGKVMRQKWLKVLKLKTRIPLKCKKRDGRLSWTILKSMWKQIKFRLFFLGPIKFLRECSGNRIRKYSIINYQ